VLDLVADAAWKDEGYDGGHFGRWRSCSRTCASNFCDSSRALEIPEGGGGRTYGDKGDKGDVALMVSPWEWRRDGDATLERESALSRKDGEDSSPGPGEVDGGVTKLSDISRRGTESFSL
jgi:hypothetical protein